MYIYFNSKDYSANERRFIFNLCLHHGVVIRIGAPTQVGEHYIFMEDYRIGIGRVFESEPKIKHEILFAHTQKIDVVPCCIKACDADDPTKIEIPFESIFAMPATNNGAPIPVAMEISEKR